MIKQRRGILLTVSESPPRRKHLRMPLPKNLLRRNRRPRNVPSARYVLVGSIFNLWAHRSRCLLVNGYALHLFIYSLQPNIYWLRSLFDINRRLRNRLGRIRRLLRKPKRRRPRRRRPPTLERRRRPRNVVPRSVRSSVNLPSGRRRSKRKKMKRKLQPRRLQRLPNQLQLRPLHRLRLRLQSPPLRQSQWRPRYSRFLRYQPRISRCPT